MSEQQIRVLVVGAKGRMGQSAVRAIEGSDGMELVGQVTRDDELAEILKQRAPDVAVDLTLPDVIASQLQSYLDARVSPVVGTTGLSPEEATRLEAAYDKADLPGLIVPNFALGAVLMMEFARRAAQVMPDAEIVEYHHPAKADSPSGTARRTAAQIDAIRSCSDPVPIHSVRIPGHLAHQEVIFGGHDERLTIRHDTLSRECFMPGLLLAVRGVRALQGLQFGLEKVLPRL